MFRALPVWAPLLRRVTDDHNGDASACKQPDALEERTDCGIIVNAAVEGLRQVVDNEDVPLVL